MRYIFALLILLILSSSAKTQAQNINTISGRVINTNQETLMGNIRVLSAADSTFIGGLSFANGVFEISGIHNKEVLLKLTSLLFADTTVRVKYNGQGVIDIGDLIINENKNQLNEVQIKSGPQLMKYNSNGNLEVNVANTILAGSSSVNEILTRSPNVIVTEGRISVFGKGDAIIYLNGKLITNERMASIPVSQISKIEIISNPSSKYDAEGKAVINVITKVNRNEGLFGSASEQFTTSEFAGSNSNTLVDLNYAKGPFSIVGNYGLLLGKNREVLYTTRTRPAESDYLKSELTTDWKRKYNNFSNFGLGVQYNISLQSDISLAYSGNFEDLGGSQNSQNRIRTRQNNSFYTSNIDKDEIRLNQSVILNYNKKLDTLGSAIFAGSQYSHFNTDVNDFIGETSVIDDTNGLRFLKNDVQHQISISSTQVDYTKISGSGGKLEAGAKFSTAYTTSGTNFLVSENAQDFELDPDLSSNFKYKELIPAAYMNYSAALSKRTKFGIGVRGEWTNYQLNTTVGDGQVVKASYFNVFPNLVINTAISDQFKLSASYVSKITRPRYQSLNPFVIYQDPFTTIEGNPNLVPEKVHSFELGTNYKMFNLKIGYNYTLNPISGAALRGNGPNSYVLKTINLDKDHTFFTSIAASFNIKWWTTMNTVSLSYSKSIDHQFSFVVVKPRPQLYLYSNNTFNISNLFKVQVLAWYLGDRYYGLYYNKSRSAVTLGLEKNFFNNAIKGRFTANDIFRRTNTTGNYNVGQTDIYFDRTNNNNYFRLSATYNFGKSSQSGYRNKVTGQAESNRAN
ncbi:hypothetical protein HDF26_001185 [Pedobacter cryoconitis]|uniref:outer membrane beta-barrel family protein n=1 Tax=Pedobacter cryoconitis TaxID=188932 RepID=UPI001607B7C0|nr:outer membrane beta-barrel family protein [Pedobacter cryoconitis]MBB6270758.1 hypothetical protein [Pedobacter cryoconitis]